MNLGLWVAPTFLSRSSPYYDKMKRLEWLPDESEYTDFQYGRDADAVRLDIGKEEYLTHLSNTFKRLKNEYNASYFKLDFLFDTLRVNIDKELFSVFEEDYLSAVFRKIILCIRETVGEDTYLLACGAPITECAGLFDGTRIASDIIWKKKAGGYSSWTIMKNCIINVILKYFYHNRVFCNDADGVVLRDYDIGDGFDGSYHEVRAWATAVALSGGIVLQNDINHMISPARKNFINELLPPLGIAAKPVDFFEIPYPTRVVIEADEKTRLLGVFNFEENVMAAEISFNEIGLKDKCIAVNAWKKDIIGFFDNGFTEECMVPHSAEMYLIKSLGNKPHFIFSDINIFMGVDTVGDRFENDCLYISISEKAKDCGCMNIYFYVPNGYTCEEKVVFSGDIGKICVIENVEFGKDRVVYFS